MEPPPVDPSVLTPRHVEILKWVLLHRAELNPLALNRLVESYRGDDNRLVLDARVVDGRPFQIQVTLQFMIELVLADPRVREWRVRWPQQQMALFDALYYVSERWRRQAGDDDTLDMGRDGLPAFVEHLQRRANVREAISLEPCAPGSKLPDDERPRWTEQQVQFLYELARRVAEGAAGARTGHGALKQRWTETGIRWTEAQQWVHEALLLEDPGKTAALLRRESKDRLRWQYDPAGQLIVEDTAKAGATAPAEDALLLSWVELIAEVDALLLPVLVGATVPAAPASPDASPPAATRKLNPLAALQARIDGRPFERLTAWKLLPSSPAWTQVRQALRNLAEPGVEASSSATLDDRSLVATFESLLRQPEFLRAIDGLVVAAAALGAIGRAASTPPDVAAAVAAGARLLSSGCGFGRADLAGIAALLGLVLEGLRKRLPGLPGSDGSSDGHTRSAAGLQASAAAAQRLAVERSSESLWSLVEPEAWSEAIARLAATDDAQQPAAAPVSADELLCAAAAGRGPAALIPLDLTEMSLRRWTRCLVSPLVPDDQRAGLVRIALERLGIGAMDEAWHRTLLEWLDSEDSKPLPPWPTVGRGSVAALVVAREQNSCTERWLRPASQGLVFVCSGTEAEELLKALPRKMPGSLRLVFESVAVVAGTESRIVTAATARWSQVTTSFMYRAGEAMLRQPAAMEPRQASDLMAALVA